MLLNLITDTLASNNQQLRRIMMGDVKVSGLVSLRKMIKARGEETEKAFLNKLTPEKQNYFQTLVPIMRISIEEEMEYYKKAASVLFPDVSLKKALAEIGREILRESMNGAYKLLLRFFNPDVVIKQAARLWSDTHYHGKAQAIKGEDGCSAEFFIEDYDDMPKDYLDVLDGYIAQLTSISGTKNIVITHNFLDNKRWSWHIQWDK